MEYVTLGKSGLTVSRFGLGCMGFGDPGKGQHSWVLSEAQSFEIIKEAVDLGVNFFDTAIAYQGGSSEQFVGRSLKKLLPRDQAIVATKFLPRTKEEIENHVSGRSHILSCCDQSLKNLGMDYIDLYIYHMWDYHTPIEEVMEAMDQLVRSGKVRAIGISNCFAWQVAKANYLADARGWSQFVSVQGHYNLIAREEEREMVPFCKDAGIALTPYSPLASGRLVKGAAETSRRLTEDAFAKGKYDGTAAMDEEIIRRVAEVAQNRGLTTTQVALGWLFAKTTAPIVGATKLHHVRSAADAVGVTLSPEDMAYLEAPYRPHPLVGVMATNH